MAGINKRMVDLSEWVSCLLARTEEAKQNIGNNFEGSTAISIVMQKVLKMRIWGIPLAGGPLL